MKNKETISVIFSERIRKFRTQQCLIQEELAFASDIHLAYVGKLKEVKMSIY